MSVSLILITALASGDPLYAREAEPVEYVSHPIDPFAPGAGDEPITFEGATAYLEGEPIGRMRFYSYVGRRDLAEDFASGRRLNTGLLIGGAVAFGLGGITIYGGYALWVGEILASRGARSGIAGIMVMGGGVALGLAGVVCALVGMVRDPDPLSEYEAKMLAVEHNRRIGAPPDGRSQAPKAPRAPVVHVSLAPGVTPNGDASLGVLLAF